MSTDELEQGIERWVLAFDGSCGTCGEISQVVGAACTGRLEVLPLANPHVEQWRASALGSDAPFAPTLIRVGDDGEVRAWTSRRMALPLIRHLGIRGTLRVLSALGQLREQVHESLTSVDDSKSLSRKGFLRLGAGVTIAGGLLFTGAAPAFAEQRQSAAASWVAANRDKLPQTYQSITAYSLDYRRAIYRALPTPTRAHLWREHIRSYRTAHPPTTEDQKRVLAVLERYLVDDTVFETAKSESRVHADQELARQVIAAFGAEEAYQIMASLGPSAQPGVAREEVCSCSEESDFCRIGMNCQRRLSCEHIPSSCGAWWDYDCDGHCFQLP